MDTDNLIEVSMTEIDLIDYTNSKRKIPNSYLGLHPKKKVTRSKVIMANLLDFYLVLTTFNIINVLINFNLDRLVIAKSIEFSSAIILKASIGLPIIFFSYFFFSYFFNHGQTFGMKTYKLRTVMPEQSMKDSFINSFRNIFMMMTLGLANKIIGSNIVKEEDYLYSEFMVHKDIAPINLLDEIENTKVPEEVVGSDTFQIAA